MPRAAMAVTANAAIKTSMTPRNVCMALVRRATASQVEEELGIGQTRQRGRFSPACWPDMVRTIADRFNAVFLRIHMICADFTICGFHHPQLPPTSPSSHRCQTSMYPLPNDPDFCHVYLIRHGATANNELNPPRIQGQSSNDGLSATGQHQACLTAQALSKFPVAAVYASPLVRASETAAAIALPHGLPVQHVDGLSECDTGDWSGMTWPEIEAQQPERYRQFQDDPATHGYGGGENLRQLVERVAPAMKQIATANLGRTIVTVAHNVVNRAYIASLLSIPPARGRSIYQDNCGINIIRYNSSGQAKVLMVNSALHLTNLGGTRKGEPDA